MARTFAALISWTLVLLSALPIAASAQNAPATVTIDASLNRHPINPNIYGVAHATTAQLNDLNSPLNRNGGNNTTRYNWQLNADNRGNDWYFESIGDSSSVGRRARRHVHRQLASGNAQAMLTIPTDRLGRQAGREPQPSSPSFSIAKYGAQNRQRLAVVSRRGQRHPDQRPVRHRQRSERRQRAVDLGFQQGWVQHLVGRWGTNANGGLRYYILDNEPSIWHATHRDVHPTGATMDEIRNKMIDYAGKIKSVDPSALVVGPEEWGWSGYLFSGYDQQYGSLHGWSFLPDRNSHGGADYLPWLLDQLRQNDVATGQRLLDVFTVHYYPQGGEFSNDVSQRDAAAAQSLDSLAVGSRTMSMKPGSTIACS